MEVRIKQGEEMVDATIEMVGGIMVVSPKEVKVTKFEPKDGDVVYSGGYRKFVFVYKDNLTTEAYFYAALSIKDNKIELPDGDYIGYVSQLRPATEEEKKNLFDRLAEEGLAWDAERKKLVKIKWKPKLGERYFMALFDNDEYNFNVIDMEEYKDYQCEQSIKYVPCFKTEQECQEFCKRLNEAINSVKP